MPTVTPADVERMRDQLFFEGPDRSRKLSRFWLLLGLSAVIATAGVIADSTATVIGAMIVAPLMTPILGATLGIVLVDRLNLTRSLLLVFAGAAAVVAIAWVMGASIPVDIVEATNGQVAARVQPRLIDLIAALATGAVGAVALARSDISDTLPGVAIAISLVPPLAVVGLTLESGAGDDAAGALLLFATNVAAIMLSGVVVMAIYRVAQHAADASSDLGRRRRRGAVGVVVGVVLVISLPLVYSSQAVTQQALNQQTIAAVAYPWAEASGWRLLDVVADTEGYTVRVAGPLPEPDPTELRRLLDEAGLADQTVTVELVPERVVTLDATG